MMLTNLGDILRNAGLRVIEVPGARTRGHGQMSHPKGTLWHHTATSAKAAGNYPSQRIVTEGRSDLPGPLCNLGLGRDGTWYFIAAGLAYHAGAGSYPGIGSNGNASLIGIEAEHPGTSGTPWPPAQIDSYRRGSAALAKAFGFASDRVIGHKEWAPRRKIDPFGLDMNAERRFVADYMRGAPAPAAPAPGGIESMAMDTVWTDTYNNRQTVEGFMRETQRDINEIHAAILALQQSRIPGDKNRTNAANIWMDAGSWTNQTLGRVASIEQKLDRLMKDFYEHAQVYKDE